MSIDFWELGLQAVNVLILVWLLRHFFWRPVAGAIAKRQEMVRALLDDANMTNAQADAALAELTEARAGIGSEREGVLAAAAAEAETTRNRTLTEAKQGAEAKIESARLEIARDTNEARKAREAQAADLAVMLAEKLLERMATSTVAGAFLASLLEAIAQMPEKDRSALVGTGEAIDLVTPTRPSAAQRTKLSNAVAQALGGSPEFNFVTDPALIAGLELRTVHFVLHNSWRSDLSLLLKGLQHAA